MKAYFPDKYYWLKSIFPPLGVEHNKRDGFTAVMNRSSKTTGFLDNSWEIKFEYRYKCQYQNKNIILYADILCLIICICSILVERPMRLHFKVEWVDFGMSRFGCGRYFGSKLSNFDLLNGNEDKLVQKIWISFRTIVALLLCRVAYGYFKQVSKQ